MIFLISKILVFHENRSIYLYIFNFSLSLLDGMSTITFLPYIGGYFSKEYIIPNYIGESLSSLIPGLLAIIQGTSSDEEECSPLKSVTNFNTSIQTNILRRKHGPKYSVSVYFLLMFSLLLISISAFTFLNFTNRAINARKSKNNDEIKLSDLNNEAENQIEIIRQNKINYENRLLYLITCLGSFINYGFMPGLLSYSTMPYGNIYFHLSINLS